MVGLDVILRHHSLLWLLGAHKMEIVMVMEHLTLVIGVVITQTQDALKKIQQQHFAAVVFFYGWKPNKIDSGRVYVYNTCIPPNMGRCANVRFEKLMLTALRGQGARNTQK